MSAAFTLIAGSWVSADISKHAYSAIAACQRAHDACSPDEAHDAFAAVLDVIEDNASEPQAAMLAASLDEAWGLAKASWEDDLDRLKLAEQECEEAHEDARKRGTEAQDANAAREKAEQARREALERVRELVKQEQAQAFALDAQARRIEVLNAAVESLQAQVKLLQAREEIRVRLASLQVKP